MAAKRLPPKPPADQPAADDSPPPTDEQDLVTAHLTDEEIQTLPFGSLKRFRARERLSAKGLYSFPVEPEPETVKPKLGYVPGPVRSQGNPRPSVPVLRVRKLRDYREKRFEWLWQGRIPGAALSVVMAQMDQGKSTLLSYLAATVSTGAPWPDSPPGAPHRDPGSVLLIQGEEDVESVHVRRARLFHADTDKIHVVEGITHGDTEIPFNLSGHILQLEAWVDSIPDLRLVMIDPIAHFMGGVDGNGDIAVRHALSRYIKIAQRKRIAIVLFMHLNKDEEKSLINRGNGTGAWLQMPRMVWFLSHDPDDPSRRLMTLVKGNPPDKIRTGLALGLKDECLVWSKKPIERTAQEVVDALSDNRHLARMAFIQAKSGPPEIVTAKARKFILDFLAGGPKLRSEVKEAAMASELTSTMFDKAVRQLLGSESEPGQVEKGAKKGKTFFLQMRGWRHPSTAIILASDLLRWSFPLRNAVPIL